MVPLIFDYMTERKHYFNFRSLEFLTKCKSLNQGSIRSDLMIDTLFSFFDITILFYDNMISIKMRYTVALKYALKFMLDINYVKCH